MRQRAFGTAIDRTGTEQSKAMLSELQLDPSALSRSLPVSSSSITGNYTRRSKQTFGEQGNPNTEE